MGEYCFEGKSLEGRMSNLLRRIWEKVVDYSNYNREEVVAEQKSELGRQLTTEESDRENCKRKNKPFKKTPGNKSTFRKRENAVKSSEADKCFYTSGKNRQRKKVEKRD